jgi:hypothetical protein
LLGSQDVPAAELPLVEWPVVCGGASICRKGNRKWAQAKENIETRSIDYGNSPHSHPPLLFNIE